MTDTLRERVARRLAEAQGEIVNDAWRFYLDDADAAIALVRAETLDEAARVADEVAKVWFEEDGTRAAVVEAASAIRALKDAP